MSFNSPNHDIKNKPKPPGFMKDYLRTNAKKFEAVRNAEKLKEEEKENFKSSYIAKYNQAILETQDRFVSEIKSCNEVFNLIVPILQEIIDFAKQNSVFPPEAERLPDLLPIQLFNKVETPSTESHLNIHYLSSNEDIISEYQGKTAWLMQKHAHLTGGIQWGWITGQTNGGEPYGDVCGIQISISHLGEVKLGNLVFSSVPELSSNEFKKALGDTFYSPARIESYYLNPSLPKKFANKQENTISIVQKLTIKISALFQGIKNFWLILWSEPQVEIDEKTSFLKKLWYGFPIKK